MATRKCFYLRVIVLATVAAILYIYFFPSTFRDIPRISPLYSSTKTPTEVPLVLILAYKRGGSSFTGNIFNSNQNAFYVFEPLYHIYERAVKHPNSRLHVDQSNSPVPVEENATLFAKELVTSYFTCGIPNIPVVNFYDVFLKQGFKTAKFLRCGKWRSACAENLSFVCHSSKLRVIKTIRMRMSDAGDLIRRLPSLKIIHLLRDPRGVIASRLKGGGNYKILSDALTDAKVLCKDMLEDLKAAEILHEQYPEKIYRLLYEDLAENPKEISEAVYTFLKLTITDGVKMWLDENTHASNDSTDFLGTRRKNSSLTSSAWRHRLSKIHASYIDQTCRDVYERVGYIPAFNLSFLTDTKIPLRKNRYQRYT